MSAVADLEGRRIEALLRASIAEADAKRAQRIPTMDDYGRCANGDDCAFFERYQSHHDTLDPVSDACGDCLAKALARVGDLLPDGDGMSAIDRRALDILHHWSQRRDGVLAMGEVEKMAREARGGK